MVTVQPAWAPDSMQQKAHRKLLRPASNLDQLFMK